MYNEIQFMWQYCLTARHTHQRNLTTTFDSSHEMVMPTSLLNHKCSAVSAAEDITVSVIFHNGSYMDSKNVQFINLKIKGHRFIVTF